jgi:5-formyltetrahydrofolate cyclo-ligase
LVARRDVPDMDEQAIRERVWGDLEAAGVARFPFPPHGRIPNYEGADSAAERLAERSGFAAAETVKCNPDAPQRPVRRAALAAGKTVYVAVPRLAEPACFLELDPDRIDDVDDATTISGADEYGEARRPDDLPEVDLIVAGSVAVTEDGRRIGKGEGYSDLEFALLREFDRVDDDTPLATTVHERQVVDEAPPAAAHDVPLDLIVTPERVLRPEATPKPAGIDWDALDEERIAEIPILQELRD